MNYLKGFGPTWSAAMLLFCLIAPYAEPTRVLWWTAAICAPINALCVVWWIRFLRKEARDGTV